MENLSNQRLKNAATILKIRKNVLIVEKLISKSVFQQLARKKAEEKKKTKTRPAEKSKRKRRGLISKISQKAQVRTGIFEGAANFFSFTFFGFLFTKILPFLPKATAIIGLFKPAGNFVAFLANFFLNTVGGFIETGYKVYDQIKGKHEEVKKISVKPAFDSFLSTLNNTLTDVVNVAYGIAGQQKTDIAQKDQKKSKKEDRTPVKGAAVGGIISPTRGNLPVNKPPTRELRKPNRAKVPTKQSVPDTNIGKDVGGEAKVRRFYNSPKVGFGGVMGLFTPKGSTISKTPVDSISTISKTLRRRNLLFGDIASVGSDIALGQKPNKTVYRNTAKDVITLAQYISDTQQEKNNSAILAMAYGGVVPSRAKNISGGNNLVELVSSVIERSVDERVNRAIGEFRRPVGRDEMIEENRRKGSKSGYSGELIQGEVYGDSGAFLSKIEMEGVAEDDTTVLGKIIQAEAGAENDLGKAAVMAVILNRYRSIKSGVAKPSQFGIFGKKPQDVTIRDIVFARNGQEFQPIRDGSFNRISTRQGQDALKKAIRSGGNDPEKLRKKLKESGLSENDAEYVVRSMGFYNPDITPSSSIPFPTKTVRVGRHGFQHSRDVQLKGKIGAINAEIMEIENLGNLLNSHEKAKHLIVMSGQKGYRPVKFGESIPSDYLHHGHEDIRNGLYVRDYGITPSITGGSQMLEGEGAPLVVPFGIKAKAVIEGPHAIRFEDPATKKVIARYHHVENIPKNINGKVIDGGTFIGTQGGRPGASSGYGSSTAVHTHLEGTLEWHRAFIKTYSRGLDVNKTNLPKKLERKMSQVQGDYDIIIPLDHVPPELVDKIPDKRGGNTFKNASQTGADGREREYTDSIAHYVSQNLQKKGYRVKIVRPEEFGNYEDYDNFIEKQSRVGTTVLPFHLDADPKRGGTGFLVRIRKNDAMDRRLAESLAPVLEKYSNIFGGGHKYGGIDTQLNATINRAAKSPAALLELGSLVTLEKLFGKNFVRRPEYTQFLDELSNSITQSVTKKTPTINDAPAQKRIKPKNSRSKKASKPQQRKTPAQKPNPKASQPNALQRIWGNVRGGFNKLTGLKKGGLVGGLISRYAPYESYGNNLVVAVQPMIIQKENVIERQIPISFPISSGVNINKHNRA